MITQSTATSEVIEEQVATGMAWIREEGPRFGLSLTDLDLPFLDVGDPSNCVLAQLGRHLNESADELWDERTLNMLREKDPAGRSFDMEWQRDHGFRALNTFSSLDYNQLTDAWIEAVRVVREAGFIEAL